VLIFPDFGIYSPTASAAISAVTSAMGKCDRQDLLAST